MNPIMKLVAGLAVVGGAVIFAWYRSRQTVPQEQRYERRRTSPKTVRRDLSFVPSKDCAICQEPLTKDPLELLPCGHLFHSECIAEWLRCRLACPVCRFEIPDHMLPEFCERLNIQPDEVS